MEGNALKTHREFPSSNSRRLKEAIALVLFDIKERCTGEAIDTEKFRNEENEKLEKALLMAFDPYTNEEVMKLVLQEKEDKELTPNILKGRTSPGEHLRLQRGRQPHLGEENEVLQK